MRKRTKAKKRMTSSDDIIDELIGKFPRNRNLPSLYLQVEGSERFK